MKIQKILSGGFISNEIIEVLPPIRGMECVTERNRTINTEVSDELRRHDENGAGSTVKIEMLASLPNIDEPFSV